MTTLSIIFWCTLAILLVSVGVYLICFNNVLDGIVGIIFIAGGIVCGFMSNSHLSDKNQTPTKQDVLDGKAIYQETQVITGNDTIKTYDIVWKQESF